MKNSCRLHSHNIGSRIFCGIPKSNYVCDYTYEGYTLEITNTVRILPIFEKSKNIEDIQPIDKVVGDDCENTKSLENNAIETSKTRNKKEKRVQFWGYER